MKQLFMIVFVLILMLCSVAAYAIDFEFKDNSSVADYIATGGTVSHQDGKLIYTVTSTHNYMQTPYMPPASGSANSPLLSIKNTLLVRLKNNSAATKLRVYFITENSGDYSEDKAKSFDIAPFSDFAPHFFNLSDVPAATGHMTGFRFVLEGVSVGSIEVEAITFEREDKIYPYAGSIASCTADGEFVTVTGTVLPQYAGQTVSLYEMEVSAYNEDMNGRTPLATAECEGENFTVRVPFMNGSVSRLSSLFMVCVDGVKLSHRFMVENYRDFEENPYAFNLPAYRVSVLDFGAVGDCYTDDTAAINAAIDHVNAQGGGTVVVPGEKSQYGRRYMVTSVHLKSNVELHIEEGAVLWQSPRKEHYTYEVHVGHDISIPGINWTHAGFTLNYPLVYAGDVQNVKITGKGTIRDDDTASENDDSVGGTIWVGCGERIHLIPLGIYHCTNVEVSDISIRRSNCYHISSSFSKNMAIRNVSMLEATCASGDGIGNAGNKNVLLDRNILYSNDDAVTFWAQYNDPRGLLWWHAHPGEDESVANIRVVHNNLYGGHGVTFIPWGTDSPDISNQEIRDITIEDNVLMGNSASIGAWPDNPYYGKGYDNTETDDFSPVKNVRIFNNRCYNITDILCIRATNLLSDCGIYSTDQFENGDFERKNGQPGWVSGFSNWSIEEASDHSTAQAVQNASGYAGKITGKQFFFQGLQRTAGNHRLSMSVNVTAGRAELVAVNGETNRVLTTVAISGSGTKTLDFSLAKPTMVKLGIRLLEDSSAATVDNASVAQMGAYAYPHAFYEDFESDTYMNMPIGAWVIAEENGNHVLKKTDSLPSYTELLSANTYTDFDMQIKFRVDRVTSTVDANFGVSFRHIDDNNGMFLEYNAVYGYWQLRKFEGGSQTVLAFVQDEKVSNNQWHHWGIRAQGADIVVYKNGTELMRVTDTNVKSGKIVLNVYNTDCSVDDVVISDADTLLLTEPKVYFKENFEAGIATHINNHTWTIGGDMSNKTAQIPQSSAPVGLLIGRSYPSFDIQMDFMMTDVLSQVDANVGLTFFRTDDDNISFFEYNPVGQYAQIRSFVNGAQTQRAYKSNVALSENEWHTMGLCVTDSTVYAYIDGEPVMQTPLWGGDNRGFLHINTYNVQGYVDNVIVAPQGTITFTDAKEPQTVTTVTDDKYYISLKNTGEGRKSVIIVSYDPQGRVEKVSLVHTDSASVAQDTHATNAKVFVWDGMRSLTQGEEAW